MKTVGYARVSSREQSQNSNALEQQVERLKAAGATEILIDVESGWKNKHRPNLDKLMALVKNGQVGQVVVTRLDRLSRQGLKSFQIFNKPSINCRIQFKFCESLNISPNLFTLL